MRDGHEPWTSVPVSPASVRASGGGSANLVHQHRRFRWNRRPHYLMNALHLDRVRLETPPHRLSQMYHKKLLV
jgi:hypothetical protein